MAIGAVLPQADHGTFQPVVRGADRTKTLRTAATGAVIIMALTAVVAMLGQSTQTELVQKGPEVSIALPTASKLDVNTVKMPTANMDELTQYFLKNGAKLTPEAALSTIRAWNAHPTLETATLMGADSGATMMLSMMPRRAQRMSLQEQSKLCEMKDKIIGLFDKLLNKLGGEELSANITYGKVKDEWKNALGSWLDSESKYRLTVEQAKEAKKGAEYASNEYEKYKVAYKQAKKDLEATLARHEKERKDLAEEREVIKEIMRYLGVLHDVKATEKSIAAGGKDSTIDPETGVSEVKAVSTAKLEASIKKLQMLAQKTNLPGSTSQLAQIQQMPVYSETEEVAKILKQMLDDLSVRLKVLEDVDAKAQEEADKTYASMVEWEQKLVKLANDKDQAKQKMMEEQLQRQKLAGVKDVATNNYDTETEEYNKVIPPYEKEIYVITMIKIKITEHCDKIEKGEASVFGADGAPPAAA